MKKSLNILITLGLIVAVAAFRPVAAAAEDINEIFKRVNDYIAKENFPKAIEELSWAEKELQKLNTQKLANVLPSEVNGFKGENPKIETALGFTNIERQYKNGGKSIKLSITGGGGGAMGGLAGLAKMGMMMGGGTAGTDQFRIDGRTASLNTESGNPEVTIFLESGSMMMLSAQSGVDGAELKKFAEAIKVGTVDDYLKGSSSK